MAYVIIKSFLLQDTKGGCQRFLFLGDPQRNERNTDEAQKTDEVCHEEFSIIQDTKYQDNFCISAFVGKAGAKRGRGGAKRIQKPESIQGEKRRERSLHLWPVMKQQKMKNDVWAALIETVWAALITTPPHADS